MSTLQTRTSLILPDDGGPGGDDTVNVTTQLSDSIDYLSNGIGVIPVADAPALPSTQNFPGRLAQTLNDGAMWIYNSGWQFWHDTVWKTFTPLLSSTGTAPAMNAGNRTGKYKRSGKDVHMIMKFAWTALGGGEGLGTGDYIFDFAPSTIVASPFFGAFEPLGFALYNDAGVRTYIGGAAWQSNHSIYLQIEGNIKCAATNPVAPANGDTYTFNMNFEYV